MRERLLKQRVWVLLLLAGIVGGFFGLRFLSDLFFIALKANNLESALNLIAPRRIEPGLLKWLPDDPTPRRLEPFRRDEITSDYRLAHEELAYALFTEDSTGLPTYFQEGALEDVHTVMGQGRKGAMVDWDHQLRLHFYAPDGATVAFTDTYRYAQTWIMGKDGYGEARLAQRRLEVVMYLDDGNWRIHHWRILSETPVQLQPILVQTKAVRGFNYEPRFAPFDLFGPKYNPREVVSDLRIAGTLGLNTVRVFLPYPIPSGAEARLKSFLDLAQQQNIKVVLTLLDGYTHYRLEDLPPIFASLQLLGPLLRHPAIWAIDAKNEPDRDFKKAKTGSVREMLRLVIREVKALSGKPVTVGFVQPDVLLSQELDLVSLHHYGKPKDLESKLQTLTKLKKPILLEEFGFHTQRLKFPDPHTELEQADHYRQMLEIGKKQRVGWMLWTLYDLPKGSVPGNRQVERHLGILQADSSPKLTAKLLMGQEVPRLGLLERIIKWLPLILTPFALLALLWIIRKIRIGLQKPN